MSNIAAWPNVGHKRSNDHFISGKKFHTFVPNTSTKLTLAVSLLYVSPDRQKAASVSVFIITFSGLATTGQFGNIGQVTGSPGTGQLKTVF